MTNNKMSQEKIKMEELTTNDLVNEAAEMSEYGWHKEVWLNLDTKEITFSGWMTTNSWNESESDREICLGTISSLDISDIPGYFAIDDSFVEIDDGNNETDRDFNDEDYERHYNESSIVPMDDALGYIADMASSEDGWYEDIFENIEKVQNGEIEELTK